MSNVVDWIGVALLGGVGAIARFAIDSLVGRRASSEFPLGTLLINLSGSFLLGLLTAAAVGNAVLFVVGTGLLGSYTTYSTWMFESERLTSDGEYGLAALNLALSVAAGFAVALAGWQLGGKL